MIAKFFTTEFSNSRMVWYDEESELQEAVKFLGHIQQLSADKSESLGLSFMKSFVIWCDLNTDVKEGDKLGNSGEIYIVKAVKDLPLGRNPHKQIFVEREEDYE